MVNGKPSFTGTTEEMQLETIFKQLGNPEASFPGVVELSGWKPEYSNFPAKVHSVAVEQLVLNRDLGAAGIDLLQRMLEYDPAKRISALEGRNHEYFSDLPEALKNVGTI